MHSVPIIMHTLKNGMVYIYDSSIYLFNLKRTHNFKEIKVYFTIARLQAPINQLRQPSKIDLPT